MTPTVLYSTPRPGLAEIRFNRPERLNAVIEALYRETLDALATAERDRTVHVVIMTGEGRAFRVGVDLKAHVIGERTSAQKREYLQLGCALRETGSERRTIPIRPRRSLRSA